MNIKLRARSLTIVIAILASVLAIGPIGHVEGAVNTSVFISLQPSSNSGPPGTILPIQFQIANVIGLNGWEIALAFDHTKLNASSASYTYSGSLLPTTDPLNIKRNITIDNTVGTVGMGAVAFPLVYGVNGTGFLAQVNFKVLCSNCTTTINFASWALAHADPTSGIVTFINPVSILSATFSNQVLPLTISNITPSPPSPRSGDTVTFTAAVIGGVAPYTYAWKFGDGSTGSGNPATHVYNVTTTTTFTVTLTVKDSKNPAATQSASILLTVLPPIPKLACGLGVSPKIVFPGVATNFTSIVNGGLSPYTYAWSIVTPAGTVLASSPNVKGVVYTATGTFIASLAVTDSVGTTCSTSQSVVVNPAPDYIGVKLHWTHHLSGATESWTIKATNPTPYLVEIKVSFQIIPEGGTPLFYVVASFDLGPGLSVSISPASASFSPPITGTKYCFTGTLSYDNIRDPVTLAVLQATGGTSGVKSGCFFKT